jgi:hypothetical protein
MRSTMIIFLGPMFLLAASCSQENQSGSSQPAAEQQEIASGPCIGSLCLGVMASNNLSNCSENISNTNSVSVKACSIDEPVSIAGVNSSTVRATVVNGRPARAQMNFPKSACGLIAGALVDSLGEPSVNAFGRSEYDELYHQFGVPPLTPFSGGRVWSTKNGFFVLEETEGQIISGFNMGTCILNIDSDWGASELKRSISNPAKTKISG